jgi:FkbH-like protein
MDKSVQVVLKTNFNTNLWKKILDKSNLRQRFVFISSNPFNIFAPTQEINHDSFQVYFCRFDDFGKQVVNYLRKDSIQFQSELESSIVNFLEAVTRSAKSIRKTIVFLPTFDSLNYSNYVFKSHTEISKKLQGIRQIYIDYLNKQTEHILLLDPYLLNDFKPEFDERNWQWNKCPYSISTLQEISAHLIVIIETLFLPRKKILVLDLDNTLWGGVVSEDGIDGIKCGEGNLIESSFYQFQKEIKTLKDSGFLLAICSKNNQDLVMETFSKRRDFALNLEDFVAWRINWNSKSQNIKEIANELNLGTDSFVFIDDSTAERAQMEAELPEVTVFEMNSDPAQRVKDMRKFKDFYKYSSSLEDTMKTKLYQDDKKRTSFVNLTKTNTFSNWITDLEIKLEYSILNSQNILRIEQLMGKTNQMNMSNRRLTENEIRKEADSKSLNFYSISATDKFGQYGTIGVVSYSTENLICTIKDFLFSCRVLGRKIEHKVVLDLIDSLTNTVEFISFEFIVTEKNQPMANFLIELGVKGENKVPIEKLKRVLESLPQIYSTWNN